MKPKRKSSRVSRRPPGKSTIEKPTTGQELIASMRILSEHLAGKIELPSYSVPSVKEIRQKLGLSQAAFARRFGLNVRSVQEWEQGRRKPDSALIAYLKVIDRNPEAVREALNP